MRMCVTEIDDTTTRVGFDGRLDDLAADDIGLQFTAAVAVGADDSIVDLSRVSYIGSTALRLFVSAARAVDHKGGKLILFGAAGAVRRVFDDVALARPLALVATEDDALARLAL